VPRTRHPTIDLNAQEQRFYDRLRERLGRAREDGLVARVGDLLLLLPDLVVLLFRLLREPRVPSGAKLIALLGIGYLFSPIDLVPEVVFGPIGLLDDLLVAGAAVSRLINYVHPDVVRAHWPGRGDALDALQRVSDWAETKVRFGLQRLLPGLRRTR